MLSATLLRSVYDNDWLVDLDPAERRLALRELVGPHVVAALADHIDGYGPLTELMTRPGVTDVLVNGPDEVWVEQGGTLDRVDVSFGNAGELRELVDRMLARSGVAVDPARPIADARLADGARVHVVLPPVAPRGPLVSIRRFPSRRFTLDDLTSSGMLGEADASRLEGLVRARVGIVVSGATGSGKTTLLNALLDLVGPGERVVTIEETPELGPFRSHVVSLVARPPNVEGAGAIDLDALVRASLRMRPDRIVVGEVRGREAAAALSAMATGHEGSMLTLHARSAAEAPERLAALATPPGVDSSAAESAVRRAIGAFAHLARRDGVRRLETLEVG